jgi:hypothetical protein
MIRYLKHSEIDFQRWDNCIANSINEYIYAYSWYLNIVAGEWDALVEDDYQRVFPLTFRKKWKIHYLYQPVFTQQLGLFNRQLQGNEHLDAFIQTIPLQFKRIEINLNKYNQPKQQAGLKSNRNIELNLAVPYSQLQQKYSTNLKRNLKKAEKENLQWIENVRPEEVIELFKKNKGAQLEVYSTEDYQRLGRLIYHAIHLGQGMAVGVTQSTNEPLAGAFILRDKTRYIFLFSGLSMQGKDAGAMPYLIDQFLRRVAGQTMIFDFEGSNNNELARFYQGFGAQEINYYSLQLNRMNPVFDTAFKLYRRFKTL